MHIRNRQLLLKLLKLHKNKSLKLNVNPHRYLLFNYLLSLYVLYKKSKLTLSTSYNLETLIQTYFVTINLLEAKKKLILLKVKLILKLEKGLKNKFSKIQLHMILFDISEKRVLKWVARLNTVAKYKRVQPLYKLLWTLALKKVNLSTRRVLDEMAQSNILLKKSETKIELELIELGVLDIVKNLLKKFTKLFTRIKLHSKLSKNLPKINV